ncbi:hypothetical protein ACT7CX_02740 [Bacillus cereus]
MPDTLRIIIYIIVVVGAFATLIKEFKKASKKYLFDFVQFFDSHRIYVFINN